jgi:hypothetical protein
MPALVLAAAFATSSALAAAKPKAKPKPAATAALLAPQWAQMPAGIRHKLRNAIDLRSADKNDWNIKKAVTITGDASDPLCQWAAAPTPTPGLDQATLLIDTDASGTPTMYVIFADKTWLKRSMTFGGPAGEQTWLSSTPSNDWNYYVLFMDTNTGAALKTPIDKKYRIEVFPPEGADANIKAHCDPERPDHSVAVASVPNRSKSLPCQTSTGTGGEPH